MLSATVAVAPAAKLSGEARSEARLVQGKLTNAWVL